MSLGFFMNIKITCLKLWNLYNVFLKYNTYEIAPIFMLHLGLVVLQ